MSNYVKMVAGPKMKNHDDVVDALRKTGIPASEITVGKHQMSGYRGAKRDVDISVKKSFHGGYGDFGFVKEDGSYTMIVDDLDDKGRLARKIGCASKYSGYVAQWYTALQAQRALRLDGFSSQIKKEGEKVVVLASR